MTYDNMVESYNQTSIFIGIKEFRTKKQSRFQTFSVSPMFCPDVVDRYREFNESYNLTAPINTADVAEALSELVALDINWCKDTYDILLSQMDDKGRTKRGLPRRTGAAAVPRPRHARQHQLPPLVTSRRRMRTTYLFWQPRS